MTGRITVTVKPLPDAAKPEPAAVARSFSASVTAGDPLTITVPTVGVDPDGDLTFVSGIVGDDGGAVDLRLGRVLGFGAATIRYEAYPRSAGTEVIHYQVRDRFGARARASCASASSSPATRSRRWPSRTTSSPRPAAPCTPTPSPTTSSRAGDSIDLEYKAPLNPGSELAKWKVDEANTGWLKLTSLARAGVALVTVKSTWPSWIAVTMSATR